MTRSHARNADKQQIVRKGGEGSEEGGAGAGHAENMGICGVCLLFSRWQKFLGVKDIWCQIAPM